MLIYPEGYAQGARVWEMSQLGGGRGGDETLQRI